MTTLAVMALSLVAITLLVTGGFSLYLWWNERKEVDE